MSSSNGKYCIVISASGKKLDQYLDFQQENEWYSICFILHANCKLHRKGQLTTFPPMREIVTSASSLDSPGCCCCCSTELAPVAGRISPSSKPRMTPLALLEACDELSLSNSSESYPVSLANETVGSLGMVIFAISEQAQ